MESQNRGVFYYNSTTVSGWLVGWSRPVLEVSETEDGQYGGPCGKGEKLPSGAINERAVSGFASDKIHRVCPHCFWLSLNSQICILVSPK